jgi:lipopolysaccharide transport protein LptA
MKKAVVVMLAGLLAGVAGSAVVPSSARADKPVDIESGSMEIFDPTNTIIFRDKVIIKRPTDTIRADEAVATYTEVKQADGTTKQEVEILDCTGNVVIDTGTDHLTGPKARIYVRKDKLEMSGGVRVVNGTTVVNGESLTSDLKTKHTVVSGGRVKGQFVPK